MGEPEQTRKISRTIEWKLNLADLIMQVDELPEDALRMLVKMQYSKMHEGAAAEGFQQINVEEAISQYGGDAREALKKYFKCWFLLNIPLEGGNMGPVPPDAPPIVQRVWKNLESLLLHPFEDEVRISTEVAKRTAVFEAAAKEYNIRFAGTLKTIKAIQGTKKEWAAKLQEAYVHLERAAKDLEELTRKYGAAEKRIETQEKQIDVMRAESERIFNLTKADYTKAQNEIEANKKLITDLSSEVDSTKSANEDLGKKVESLESELNSAKVEAAKEKADKETYQQQSLKLHRAYDDKEKDYLQVNEQVKFERSEKENAKAEIELQKNEVELQKKQVTDLEKKLSSTKAGKTGWLVAAAALVIAGVSLSYRPSAQTPVENVPQEVINYSKDRFTIKFGNKQYEMSADRFNEIYSEIQRDQQKAGKQFTPADRKQYFEKKIENTRQIK